MSEVVKMDMAARARAVLRANDRGGYSVPTAQLYPFQWNWDSAFVAMGLATFDASRAWQEIESLLRGQWQDGLIPQIVFHAPSDEYFPGPEVWGTHHTPPTSGITQPPVLATAARYVLETDRDSVQAAERMAAVYPRLLANHRWWVRARDPGQSGLVTTLHPWETGMDNSPAWDAALARVPADTVTPIRRRDTTLVDAAFRPRGEEYQRFIHLVELFRAEQWRAERMLAVSPFKVVDVGTNAILLRAERDLLVLAKRFGSPADQAEIAARIARMESALAQLWRADLGLFASRDSVSGTVIEVATSAGFLPFFAHAASSDQCQAMGATLDRWASRVAWLVPSTDPCDARFEPVRYWRGPVWPIVNWMIAEGLAATGDTSRAAMIRFHTRQLIETAGPREYFDPTNGDGAGGTDLSWTAAIYLLLTGDAAAAV